MANETAAVCNKTSLSKFEANYLLIES